MVKVLIVYYSRTGTTKALAAALAERLNADTVEIRCPRYRPGMFRYLRAGYDSVKGNLPPIDMPRVAARDYDTVLLGAPIWTSHPALPLRAFLAQAPDLPARVGLFLTHGAHSPPGTAVKEAGALLPGRIEASLAVREADVRKNTFADVLAAFADRFA